MAKSTLVSVEEQIHCTNDVFVVEHCADEEACCGFGRELLGIFTTERVAKKCAAAAKREDGYKGKEAKFHSYNVEPWAVSDKFDG